MYMCVCLYGQHTHIKSFISINIHILIKLYCLILESSLTYQAYQILSLLANLSQPTSLNKICISEYKN